MQASRLLFSGRRDACTTNTCYCDAALYFFNRSTFTRRTIAADPRSAAIIRNADIRKKTLGGAIRAATIRRRLSFLRFAPPKGYPRSYFARALSQRPASAVSRPYCSAVQPLLSAIRNGCQYPISTSFDLFSFYFRPVKNRLTALQNSPCNQYLLPQTYN